MATVRPFLSWTGMSQATRGMESVESKKGFDQKALSACRACVNHSAFR